MYFQIQMHMVPLLFADDETKKLDGEKKVTSDVRIHMRYHVVEYRENQKGKDNSHTLHLVSQIQEWIVWQ